MNDQEHYSAHPAMARGQPALFIFCLLLVPAGVGILALLFWWLWARCATLTVADGRVILQMGILTRRTSEVLVRDIRNVQITQGPLQRFTDAGKIGISSAGQADVEIEIDGMLNPQQVKAIINKCRGV